MTIFFIKDFLSKCDQIRRKMWIWLHLLKKYLMENLIFCAVNLLEFDDYDDGGDYDDDDRGIAQQHKRRTAQPN